MALPIQAYITTAAGVPVNGAKIYTYEGGTLSPKAVYTTAALTVAHPNPIIAANGRATYFLGAGNYRIRVTDAADVELPQYALDNINAEAVASGSIATAFESEVLTATAGQTTFTLNTIRYVPGSGSLKINIGGLILQRSDFTELSATSFQLDAGLSAGTVVEVFSGRYVTTGVNAAQVGYTATGGTARSQQSKNRDFATLEDFGGSDGGVIDNLAAFNAAIAAGVKVLHATGDEYYFSAGIIIPDGVAVYGGSFMPSNPPRGTRFKFALSVPTCVTLCGPSVSNGNAILRRVSVTRAAGTPPVGSVGVLAQNFYALNLEEVAAFSHAKPFVFKGDGGSLGITAICEKLYSGGATDAHVEIDSIPEVRFSQCRHGMNGTGDYACNAYIRIKGGSTTNPAGGVNTIIVENSQYNQGNATNAAAWVEFVEQTPGNVGDVSLFQFDTVYVETADVGIRSDATWPIISRLQINNLTFNRPAGFQFFALNAATRLDNWQIDNSQIFCNATLAPTPQINFFGMSNTQFGGPVSITGPTSGSVASIADCNFAGGLTLAGTWASLTVKGGAVSSGSFVNTATSSSGGVDVDIYPFNALTAITPALRFGGASTGITYSTQLGAYQVNGKTVDAQVRLVLTNKGSATGIASISLPAAPDVTAAGYSIGNGSSGVYALGMASLAGPISGTVGAGPIVNLYQYGATGITSLTEANFTNSSEIALRVSYLMP